MLKSYLRIAVRNLKRRRLYTSINIFGLAVGLAMCLITIGHLSYELSFEDMHEKKDRIYRVNVTYQAEDREEYLAYSMPALGPALKEEIPEVEKVALFKALGNVNLKVGEEKFIPERQFSTHGYEHGGNVLCANADFLEVFTFPLVAGDPRTVLSEPYSIIITERAAEEHFHGLDPIGQTVQIHDSLHCQITGIMEDMSENTQLYCDFIISHATLERMGHNVSSWDHIRDDYAYLLLAEDADWKSVEQKIPGILQSHVEPEEFDKYAFELQNLKSIYFYAYESGRWGDLHPSGEASMMWTIGLIALFVLLLAIANFVNLSTARSADRMREVGVRKVFGAFRGNLVKQFLGESFIITTIAFLIGLVIYEVFKQSIQDMLPREAFADFYTNGLMLFMIISLLVVVGVLAGYYPALYLSRFKPVAILQSKSSMRSSKSFLRKALVVFQFTIAIGFVCCSTIVSKQMSFIQSVDLGFARENVLILDFEGEDAADNCMLMKNEVLSKNRVLSATVANCPPGRRAWHSWGFYTDAELENMEAMWTYFTDYDFVSTFDLEIVEGRGFSEEFGSDDHNSMIINETAVKTLGINEPIGYSFYAGDGSIRRVIGVVKDFHGSPLDYAYRPYSCIMLRPEKAHTLSIVLPPDDIPGSLAAIEETWNSTLPDEAFSYSFLDEEIRNNYESDEGPNTMMMVLSVLTTMIACLGVLALVSFTAEQRTKEIGIRKVLGASVSGVVILLSKEFIILIAIANAIAWPFAYWVMSQFLNEFAFRISIGVDTFLFTAMVAMVAAMFAAGFQAIRAATANPTDALQHE